MLRKRHTDRKNDLYKTGMRCKGRVFRDTGQGAKIIVVLIGLVVIFQTNIQKVVTNIFKKINTGVDKVK